MHELVSRNSRRSCSSGFRAELDIFWYFCLWKKSRFLLKWLVACWVYYTPVTERYYQFVSCTSRVGRSRECYKYLSISSRITEKGSSYVWPSPLVITCPANSSLSTNKLEYTHCKRHSLLLSLISDWFILGKLALLVSVF